MDEKFSKKSIGMRIRDLRVQYNISQETIASITGMSRSNYSQIELGNQYPSFVTLNHIASYYNSNYEWIINGDTCDRQTVNEIDSAILTIELAIIELKGSLEKFRSKTGPDQK